MTDQRKNSQNNFEKLKKNILFRVLALVGISILLGIFFLVVFVDGIFQDSFAEFMVDFFMTFGLDFTEANNLYFWIFMNNKDFWMLTGLLIILAIAFYVSLSKLTKYFDEVSDGVDKLLKEDGETIQLSPELDFMESKLNDVKNKLKKKEIDARESEQRKNDMVVYLAHDIKTPLTSVIGYLNLLEEAPDMPAENRAKYMNITLDKAYRLEELINEFFEITRFNLQSIVLEKNRIDLDIMLRQVADEFYPSLEQKNLSTRFDMEKGLCITGDSQKLARVFNNIMRNAVLYSHNDNSIDIKAKNENGQILITITNTGDIIPQDKLDAIFEKFYRLDKSRSSDSGGAGLGLAIAREIVIAHGGSISAKSEDSKTTFIISLPEK